MAILRTHQLVAGSRSFSIDCGDLSIDEGAVLGVLGRSGTGKSTLIETFIGLRRPLKGEVFIEDKPVHHSNGIGFVPQSSALWNYLSVIENLRTFGRIYGVPRKELERRIKILLQRLDLEGHEHKRITQLSGGMKRRVDFAVGVIHMPKLIVLDEPFTGLDETLRVFLWKFLLEIVDAGTALVIASHMLDELKRYATDFLIIDHRNVFISEEIDDMILDPSNTFEDVLRSLI